MIFGLFAAIGLLAPVAAQADDAEVQTAWRLLDYIAVDYPEAVADGRVVNALEYDEMREFSATVGEYLADLPEHPAKGDLIAEARRLEIAIGRKLPPAQIERRARQLANDLLSAYPVPLAPAAPPDLARGATLYQANCASCHAARGTGDGPLAAGLDPAPIDFTDQARARERSSFAFYQVIHQGLEGTAMRSYDELPTMDKWALAFEVGRYAYPAELAGQGRRLWDGDAALRTRIPDLETLAGLTPAALARDIGEEDARAVIAYLRGNPGAVTATVGIESLATARDLLNQSVAAYAAGERDAAGDLALAAYLDGFEPVETLLAARDGDLVAQVERAMGDLRTMMGRGAPPEAVASQADELLQLFDQAEMALAPDAASSAATFFGAFAILLREGLEALLIVVAMITFLLRADRRDLLRYVHAGWIGALAAGVGTWWVATNLISISGANRELTEGFGSLLAAAILLFVGIWMHGKAQAGAWQAYVRDKLDKALSQGSAWLLFGLAFVAVYREVFETIIFYAALGAQGEGLAMAGGMGVAALLLALIAWAMLRFSRKLPIAKFFAYSAALIAVLAVVLAGKGVAALQEAGLIGFTALDGFPRSPILGLYPTLETVTAQAVTILLLVAGFLYAQRTAPRIGAAVPVGEG
ncbi:MAG: c-type cytochrome [Sphingomonadaceae bacterium]|nr:c-type cytochrome [Sphingomonadaceae bacterium]